jgi:protein SCO1
MILLLVVGFVLAAFPAQAQTGLPAVLRDVGIDQRLNQQVPLDLSFRDESGRIAPLREYFGSKPVILTLVYYQCPMLCTLVLNGVLQSLRKIQMNVGEQFEVVTVSFDPRETPELAAAKKKSYIQRYGRPGAARGWHFLTGDEASIAQLTRAVGFRYAYDSKSGQYAHASAIMVLTPQGRLARYFYGVEYQPRDVRLALVEASANRIGNAADQVLLFCFHYDPATGKYGLAILNVLRAACLATVVAMGALFWFLSRRRRRGVEMSLDAARTSACATNRTGVGE